MRAEDVFKPPAHVAMVDCPDLSRYVSELYRQPWSMLATGEYSQDTYVTVDVDESQPDGWSPEDASRVLMAWLSASAPGEHDWEANHRFRSLMPHVDVILWDLCRSRVIVPGEYLIKVWW